MGPLSEAVAFVIGPCDAYRGDFGAPNVEAESKLHREPLDFEWGFEKMQLQLKW